MEFSIWMIWGIFEDWGWYILFGVIACYYLYKYYIHYKIAQEKRKSYEEATDPQRVALLEEERQRIRNRQFAQYTGKNKYQVDLS